MLLRKRSSAALFVATSLLLLCFAQTEASANPGEFSFTGNMNNARWGHTATLLDNGLVLIVGGFKGTGFVAAANFTIPRPGRLPSQEAS
jgi:hypothetical protein